MTRILVFGDSITFGARDNGKGGWVRRLAEHISDGTEDELSVYNVGISGDTTEDLLRRFEPETKERLCDDGENIFIFAIGINDTIFLHEENSIRTSKEKFRKNIENLISSAKKFSSKIFFIGLTPVDEAYTTPIPWDTIKSYKNEYIKTYDTLLNRICDEKDIPFIKIFDTFKEKVYETLLADGLHPNSKGYQKMFEIVKEPLLKCLK